MPETLKLAVIADMHHGPSKLTKIGEAALPLLRDFAAFAADYRPHYVVDLGDRISDIDAETDRRLLTEVTAGFAEIDAPRHHLIGNHDQVNLSIAENGEILGQSTDHHSADVAGRHLVFWQLDSQIHRPQGLLANPADLRWLADDLAASKLPTIVFSHVPLDGGSMQGNYYFDNNPGFGGFPHQREIQALFRQAGNVILCVAGHVHWNDVNLIDGIPHITIQSLTESFTTEGEAAAAWASVEIDDEIRWRSHGRDPIVLQVPVRSLNAHWRAPLPPFEELARQREIPEGLDDIDGLILDMDGVLYRGPEPIPGAAEAVSALRAAGIGIVALTNNARAAADDYADRLAGMGIDLPAGNIITSGQATARYLKEQAEAPAVFVAGSPALRQEVLAAGATESERPDFVVAGVDLEMPLAALAEAVRHLDAGARLIASNPDRRVPGAQGFEPEAGAVQAFLEAASGQTAVVPGKPNRLIFEMALERLGRRRQAVAVVGDSPDTDIAGANGAGLRSVLLASGNADPGDSPHRPTERLADLAALAERLLA